MAKNERLPREEEIDVYGLTHPGKVRKVNQDHFLVCSLYKRLKVHATSLPLSGLMRYRGDRLAFMVVVADGVGGQRAGEDASRIALETVARYVTESMECYYAGEPNSEQRFLEQLHESVMECHARVVEKARADPDRQGMATTLTLAIGHWPWAYVVQVGDSRCYQMHDGVLCQITRDQTVAQYLHDRGMINTSELEGSKYSHMLSSAIGGPEAVPAANRIKLHWHDAILLCSDGLPRHVPDDRIRERLLSSVTAREACEALLQDALDGGGHDNITVVVGRARPGSEDALSETGG